MATLESKTVERETAPPIPENPKIRDESYTDVIVIKCSNKNSYSSSLCTMLASFLSGKGNVSLVSMSVLCRPTGKGQAIYFGLSAANSEATAEECSVLGNGFYHVSTEESMAQQLERVIVPLSNTSTQIFPISSTLPAIRVVYNKSEKMALYIKLHVLVRGVRFESITLN